MKQNTDSCQWLETWLHTRFGTTVCFALAALTCLLAGVGVGVALCAIVSLFTGAAG